MTSQQKVSRRTIAKGAAWSVPVVAVAAAAPAASASTATADVVVTHTCVSQNILGTGLVSRPQFNISAVDQPVAAGSTYALSGTGLANISLAAVGGSLVSVSVLSGTSATVTVNQAIPAGGTVSFQVVGIATVAALTTFTLALLSETGNDNTNKGNDAASGQYLGVAALGYLIGACR